ncbi:hypothetical protein OESDEN_04373 [Oesophagostomum dentatum]|uniref:AMP-dependent synthetase/ligase domain-containing protein n=1 Tax=Oesophagostomum dentatum TaxID=61180 RepID=A0A0B1TEL3_OESDE|nr:hypothetical protein OESDEN_04373 [Oesophagostomum dentatum]
MSWKRLRPGVLIRYVNLRSASTGQNIVKSSYPSVPIPSTSFPGYVLSAIKKYAANNRTAFICAEDNKPVTYKNIVDSAYALATFLSKNGFHEGVASAVLPNNSEFSSLFLGVTLNRGILTSVSPVSTEYELLNHFLDSEARLVITNQQSLQKVLKAAHKCPSIKMILCMDTEQTAALPSRVHNWKDIMETTPDNNFTPPQVDADKEPVFMPYSSGTCGTPKGVMLTHRNMIAMMNIFMSLFGSDTVGYRRFG